MKDSLPSRRRSRTALAVALVVIAGVAVSACDSGAARVAKVNGTTINSDRFAEGVPLFAKLSGATKLANDQGVSPVANAAQYAMFLVQTHAIDGLNHKHGTKVSATEVAAMRQSLVSSDQTGELRKAPTWFVDDLAVTQANFQGLVNYYGARVDANARVAKYYNANKAQFQQVCMDVIAGNDESQLAAAKQRITQDKDGFATVAKAVAAEQPPVNGAPARALGDKADGDVGCVAVTNLTSLFASPSEVSKLTDAKDGAIVGPVPVAGGSFMLFRVRESKVETLAEAKPTIVQAIGPAGSTEAQQALNDYLMKAKIELNPRLGSWKTGVGYNPPKGATHPGGTTPPLAPVTGEG